MKQPLDDFDLQSVEEYYTPHSLHWIECDNCQNLSLASNLHIMQSFQSKTDLLLCKNCYRKLHD